MQSSSSLLEVTEIIVPRGAVARMHAFLAEAGRAGSEGFTAWAGVQEGSRFVVHETVIPRQRGISNRSGLCVLIDANELFLMNRWLYEKGLTLIAQIHSHPTDAFHSELDDEIPIATTQGCVSIVVPDFARYPFSIASCAVFRLSTQSLWEEMSPAEASSLIKIV
jgi:hypothetical protein